jgi:hypothetical protein
MPRLAPQVVLRWRSELRRGAEHRSAGVGECILDHRAPLAVARRLKKMRRRMASEKPV